MIDNRSAYDSSIYDENIITVLPYYREYRAQIIDLIRALDWHDIKWLDTGCGTGTLAAEVLGLRNDVHFTLCDPSDGMLETAREKHAGKDVEFLKASSGELAFDRKFDVVTAVQCHHYLTVEERRKALENCHRALREGGVFVTFENIRMSADESDAITLKRWTNFLADNGRNEEGIEFQLSRRGTEVLPITIEQHIALLREAGFRSVDLIWASYLQAGLWAIK